MLIAFLRLTEIVRLGDSYSIRRCKALYTLATDGKFILIMIPAAGRIAPVNIR